MAKKPTKAQARMLVALRDHGTTVAPGGTFGGGYFKTTHALVDRGWMAYVPDPDDPKWAALGRCKAVLTDAGRAVAAGL